LFYVNEDRQTCLFSATMPPEILRLAQEYMKEFEEVRLNEEELSLDTIDQSYLIVYEKEKFRHLCDLIRIRDKKQTIVFAATKQRTHRLASELKQEGFRAITIHGDLTQRQRDNAMYRFKRGDEDILVATDIAARGIDVPAVGHVINYDIPEDPLIYFHRIGRTARAGATGKAISLVSQDRIDDFGRILRQTKHPIRKLNEEMGVEVPTVQRHHTHSRSFGRRYQGYEYGNQNRDRWSRGTRYRKDVGNRYRQAKRHDRGYSHKGHYSHSSYRNSRS
jgi:ATP-dependent RNA helicase DeaD